MNQAKSGKFIQDMRKVKGLTQLELADKLMISDKTVSKWERGCGMPELSLMVPLCNILGITVNELLTGEKLSSEKYIEKAEENIMDLMEEKQSNKRKLWLALLIVIVTMLSGMTLIMVVSMFDMPAYVRIIGIAVSVISIVGGIIVACYFDVNSGTFECANCHEKFVPSYGKYIMGIHTSTKRYMKCPKCGKKTWCTKRLTH